MERPTIIRKTDSDLRVPPNLDNYEAQRRSFRWDNERRALQGLPGGGLNIAFEAVDRHAAGPLQDRSALRFVARNAPALDLSYGELALQPKFSISPNA